MLNISKKIREKVNLLDTILLIIVIGVSIICLFNAHSFEKSLEIQTNLYLNDTSDQLTVLVNEKIGRISKKLESIADTVTYDNYNDLDDLLRRKANIYDFLQLGIIDLQGNGKFLNDYFIDCSNIEAFKKASNGENAVSVISDLNISEEPLLMYCVPVRVNEKIEEVIAGIKTEREVQALISTEIFSKKSFSAILNEDGEIIISNPNEISDKLSKIFIDDIEKKVIKDKELFLSNEKGYVEIELLDNQTYIIRYCALEAYRWFLVTMIPKDALLAGVNTFITSTFIYSIVLIIDVIIFFIITLRRKKAEKKLEEIAFVDPITGGGNRAKFEIEARKLIDEHSDNTFIIGSFNIRDFKLINNRFGTDKGNETLKYVYNEISSFLKKDELVARSHADIFHILIKNDSRENIINRIEKICQDINLFNSNSLEKFFFLIDAALYVVDSPNDMDMISFHDRVSVARKNSHKKYNGLYSRVSFFEDTDLNRLISENEITNIMENSLKNKEFVVYFQPKFDLKTEKIGGAEALVRWNHTNKGIISPSDFIPIFEKNNFIIELDLYVFDEVCRKIQTWIDEGRNVVPVSINLSRCHLKDENFLERYRNIYEKYNIPSELIELELTETVVFENMELLSKVIDDIHKIGFKCSLDDFGSGYSSLSILKSINVDTLKIDKEFFIDKGEGNKGRNIIKAVIELARILNISTVSEGIETKEQLGFLKQTSCDMVQGYIFSRPLPSDEFEDMIKE